MKGKINFDCPTCGSNVLDESNLRCLGCGSVERQRLLYLVTKSKIDINQETAILLIGNNDYIVAKALTIDGCGDLNILNVDQCMKKEAERGDKVEDKLGEINACSIDLIIHSHIIQKLTIDLSRFIEHSFRILKPNGLHIFTAPTRELPEELESYTNVKEDECLNLFGHRDHVRIVGLKDLESKLMTQFGNKSCLIEPYHEIEREKLRISGISSKTWFSENGARPKIFCAKKRDKSSKIYSTESINIDENTARNIKVNTYNYFGREITQHMNDLDMLKRDNPWPDISDIEQVPFVLALGSGEEAGRQLIINKIREANIKLMIEVGVFLGGSTVQWLESKNNLEVIGIDPWTGSWGKYIYSMINSPNMSTHLNQFCIEEIESIIKSLDKHGNYKIALNNLTKYRHRFIPIRQYSPKALVYLKKYGIWPELIYIDAFKRKIDLEVAYALFPNSVLCGDDWQWRDANGDFGMQRIVKVFASKYNFDIEAERQTWILHRKKK